MTQKQGAVLITLVIGVLILVGYLAFREYTYDVRQTVLIEDAINNVLFIEDYEETN